MRKPSKEEIIQYIDEASDIQKMSENHIDLSITKYEQSVSSPMQDTNLSFDPYKNKSFIDTQFRGTQYFNFGSLLSQVLDGKSNEPSADPSKNLQFPPIINSPTSTKKSKMGGGS